MNITLKQSETQINKAKEKALELGVPMTIAILDNTGYLKAFVRMDKAVLGAIDIAIKKAKTAMLFGRNSEDVGKLLQPAAGTYGASASSGGLMGFAGGIPIKENGETIGFIGVSGGPQDIDFAVASAGAAID